MNRKVILYISMSLDGYIAAEKDDLSFLELVNQPNEDYGYTQFLQTIDTVLIGRKTYDWVIQETGSFHHADKESYVISKYDRPDIQNTHFYTGDLSVLITALKAKTGKNIFCDGGAQLAQSLFKEDLIDEMILSIIPVILGSGTRLFDFNISQRKLTLLSTTRYESGLIQSHYQIEKINK